jgi:hypothetical protein
MIDCRFITELRCDVRLAADEQPGNSCFFLRGRAQYDAVHDAEGCDGRVVARDHQPRALLASH